MHDDEWKNIDQFISFAYQESPAIKEIFSAAEITPKDIQSTDDLEKIPVTSKDRLVELQDAQPPFGGFLTVPLSELHHVFLSPGPLHEPHAGESGGINSIRNVLSIANFVSGDIVLNSFGYHLIPTGLLIDQSLRELGVTVIPAGVGNAELQIKLMKDLNVTGYVGPPSWLMALIENIDQTNLDFVKELSLEKVLVSAEPLPPSMREIFVDQYKLQVTNAYGTAELGFLAVNTDGSHQMQLLDSSIIQVVNPDDGKNVNPGEVGEIVVTNFDKTYPLIRLGTGDLAMNIDPSPGKSRQSERSIILVGRVGDAVKVRGMLVHPNQLRFSVGQLPGIAAFQAVVSRIGHRDSLLLKAVLSEKDQNLDMIREHLIQAVRSTCRINVDQIDFVGQNEIDQNEPLIIDQRSWQ